MLLACWSFYGQNLRMERGRYIGNLVGVASIHSFEYIHDELLDVLIMSLSALLVAKSDVIKINPGCGKRGGDGGIAALGTLLK